jgi:hypothetical protein
MLPSAVKAVDQRLRAGKRCASSLSIYSCATTSASDICLLSSSSYLPLCLAGDLPFCLQVCLPAFQPACLLACMHACLHAFLQQPQHLHVCKCRSLRTIAHPSSSSKPTPPSPTTNHLLYPPTHTHTHTCCCTAAATVRHPRSHTHTPHSVYVHCTAGLGRAPAVCIAWLYWYGPHLSLDVAYNHVTSIRPCGPKRDAVRGATFDLLDHRSFQDFDWLPPDAWATLSVHDRERLQARLAARRD